MSKRMTGILLSIFALFLTNCSSNPQTKQTTPTPSPSATTPATSTPQTTSLTEAVPTATEYPFSKLPGRLAYVDYECNGLCTNLAIIQPDLSDRQILTDHNHGLAVKPFWSPSGQYIAYIFYVLGEDGGTEIRIYDLAMEEVINLTPQQIENTSAISELSWSPDNQYILLVNTKNNESNIQKIDIQSKEIANLTTASSYQDINPAWSPNNTEIVFSSNRPGTAESTSNIWIMDTEGANLVNLTPNDAEGWQDLMPSWSPDGEHITFLRHKEESSRSELWIMDADGKNQELLFEFEGKAREIPRWSPDGNQIALIYGNEENTDVIAINWKENKELILNDSPGLYYGVSWAPHSQALIFTQKKSEQETTLHIRILLGDEVYRADANAPIIDPTWSPVSNLPYLPKESQEN